MLLYISNQLWRKSEYIKKNSMKYGLKEIDIQKIISVFATYPEIEKAILYGSRAKGNYREGSDIDLSLVGKALNFDILLKIETQLDDLLLPYTIDVSLYQALDNFDLIQHIDRVGIRMYEKTNK